MRIVYAARVIQFVNSNAFVAVYTEIPPPPASTRTAASYAKGHRLGGT